MTESYLKQETAAVACDAVEQALRTICIEYEIVNTSGTAKCRICEHNGEDIWNVTATRMPLV